MSDEEKEEAARHLSLKANKKMLQDKLARSTGKSIILKDLSNLKEKMKAGKSRNDLDTAVKQLSEKHGKFIAIFLFRYKTVKSMLCLYSLIWS